jgi:hypothetical protein
VAEFVRFYAGQIDKIAQAAQFVQLNEEQKTKLQAAVDGLAA